MSPLVVAFVLLFVLTGVVGALGRKQVKAPDARDRRSSMVLGLCHTAILVCAALCAWRGWGLLPVGPAFAWAAVAAMAVFFALQLWAMRSLGRHFTLTLTANHDQPIVEHGPYRLLRHPGYLAQILFFLAFGAATRSGIALAVVALAVALGYGYRIHVEEELLRATLGARYDEYARRTRRLVPWVY
jgi:protein-S-isoprenylcysteine O-methyltransferase